MEKPAPSPHNPFTDSAAASLRAASYYSHPSDVPSGTRQAARRQFKSYRLNGEYERPWLGDRRLQKTRVGNYIIWGFVVLGLGLSGYINFSVTQKVSRNEVCLTILNVGIHRAELLMLYPSTA